MPVPPKVPSLFNLPLGGYSLPPGPIPLRSPLKSQYHPPKNFWERSPSTGGVNGYGGGEDLSGGVSGPAHGASGTGASGTQWAEVMEMQLAWATEKLLT